MPPDTLLSAKAYAKHRGVSLPAVMKAISEERLKESVRRRGPGYQINVELADREWAENTDSMTGAPAHMSRQGEAPLPTDDGQPISYAEARAQHERFKARLAQLELEQREGKLVEAEAVKREGFRVARLVRDSLLNLPDRVAGELAAETNQFKVHLRLTQEIRRALEDLKLVDTLQARIFKAVHQEGQRILLAHVQVKPHHHVVSGGLGVIQEGLEEVLPVIHPFLFDGFVGADAHSVSEVLHTLSKAIEPIVPTNCSFLSAHSTHLEKQHILESFLRCCVFIGGVIPFHHTTVNDEPVLVHHGF